MADGVCSSRSKQAFHRAWAEDTVEQTERECGAQQAAGSQALYPHLYPEVTVSSLIWVMSV